MKVNEIKKIVRERYGSISRNGSSCCGTSNACSCTDTADETSNKIGYSTEEINVVPEGANLGLGCGNPVALASLKEGETVLDLGSGGGFDCFLASEKVGSTGYVIGVDMTPEMLDRARNNALKGDYGNVEFRLGEIENLPVVDNSIDAVISNCVINLSPDKRKVFKEIHRVLKPGGRIMVSDIVLSEELPEIVRESASAYAGCIGGATLKDKYIALIAETGFREVRVVNENTMPLDGWINDPIATSVIEDYKLTREQVKEIACSISSINLHAVKV